MKYESPLELHEELMDAAQQVKDHAQAISTLDTLELDVPVVIPATPR
jgi:hypothetical protein